VSQGLDHLFSLVQASAVARMIGESTLITGLLSGLHLVGLTLLVGGVLITTLRFTGVALAELPTAAFDRAVHPAILIGLAANVVTGLLLVSPRIATASANRYFQIKLLLLVAAVTFYFSVYRKAMRGRPLPPGLSARIAGVVGFLLWLSVVIAGCGFILLE
jgi:hypothetical protein